MNSVVRMKQDYIRKQKTSFSRSAILIWVNHGEGNLVLGKEELHFHHEDLIFVPKNCSYRFECDNFTVLTKLYLSNEYFPEHKIIDINTTVVKTICANYLQNIERKTGFDTAANAQEFIAEIIANSQTSKRQIYIVKDDRILEAISYIEGNFASRFTTQDVADLIFINPAYLSTFFKQEIGISLVKYTNQLRLERGIELILETDKSITQIAHEIGVADVRTLNALLKDRFQETPMILRKKYLQHHTTATRNYSLEKLISKYSDAKLVADTVELNIEVDTTTDGKIITNNLHTLAIGRAHDILYANVQQQIISSKQELNFKYCRFHNIFGDEMHIFDMGYGDQQTINLSHVFKVLDFLVENDILPFVELGFFPTQISASTTSPFPGYHANVGGKINFQLWQSLISTFATEVVNRYPDNYHLFYFDFFNEPDVAAFWQNDIEDFIKLYRQTYKTFKQISSQFKLGGFGFGNFESTATSIIGIIDRIYEENCKLDFVSIHSYPFYVEEKIEYSERVIPNDINVKYVQNKIIRDIELLDSIVQKYQIDESFITEWNTSVNQRETLNDTIYKSSKIIEQFLSQIESNSSGLCYWALTDEICEFGYHPREIHGGFGLISRNGIRKPAYNAVKFIGNIHGELLYNHNGICIVRNSTGYHILLNNCQSYTRSYPLDIVEYTPVITLGNKIILNLKLLNIKAGKYYQQIQSITAEQNLNQIVEKLNISSTYISQDDIEIIQKLSLLKSKLSVIEVDDYFSLNFTIKPGESHLITLSNIA